MGMAFAAHPHRGLDHVFPAQPFDFGAGRGQVGRDAGKHGVAVLLTQQGLFHPHHRLFGPRGGVRQTGDVGAQGAEPATEVHEA